MTKIARKLKSAEIKTGNPNETDLPVLRVSKQWFKKIQDEYEVRNTNLSVW